MISRLLGSLPIFWISFRASERDSMEMNWGLWDVIGRGIRIGLIRTYPHILLMKGSYLLVMQLQNDTSVLVGKLRLVEFQKGCYVYVGSALNGLEQRIQRHLRRQKKIHWHIDYLLPFTKVVDIFYKESTRREECMMAQEFERIFTGIPGFGCSDCACKSHLFLGSLDAIEKAAVSVSMELYPSG